MKYKSAIFILIVLFSISYFLFFLSVSAFVSTSTNFQIHSADIQSISGEGASDSFRVRSAGGQTAAGLSQEIKKIYSGILYWLYGVPEGGTLSVGIVNGSYESVGSPTMAMDVTAFSWACQTITGSFGTTTPSVEQIYINNNNGANNGWTLTIAAESNTDVWDSAGTPYDFNDPSGSPAGCANGQMTVDPSVAILAVGQCSGCSVTNITKGDPYAFNQGTLDTILLLTATAASDDVGDWTLQGVSISQKIPAEQPAAIDYNINMVLTVAAN